MENITGVTKTQLDLTDINRLSKENLKFLIEFSARKYDCEIEVIANNIIYGNRRFVLLSGPSSSGKTTTSLKLKEALAKQGRGCVTISLDDFFINRDKIPKLEDGMYDFDNFDILDRFTLNKCISELMDQYNTYLPTFDFIYGKRTDDYRHIKVSDNDVIIIEGTHALNPKLLKLEHDLFYRVYVCVYSNFQIDGNTVIPAKLVRFMRRLIRDVQARGTSIEETLAMWNHVCEGEDKYIKPYRVLANYLLDTTHMYEPLLYRTYLEDSLRHSKNSYGIELYNKLQHCEYLDESILPDDSLLWEFLVK
ncbi:MAG: nucleoside kinase [Clostridia bacterium]|nr:nucleoside kinase [Clostridia bacterium]